MKYHLTAGIALLVINPLNTHASIEEDKIVGACVGYLVALERMNGAETALSLANNQSRALHFAKEWMKNATTTAKTSSSQMSLAASGESNCRKIGIRPGDYSN